MLTSEEKVEFEKMKNAQYKLPTLTSSQIDTCGYTDVKSLLDAAVKGNCPMSYYITDLGAVLTLTTDNMEHALFQDITGIFDVTKGVITATHTDGIHTTARRAYFFNMAGPSYLGYTSSDLNKWTLWRIQDTAGLSKVDVSDGEDTLNQLVKMYGTTLLTTINSNDGKLTITNLTTGGTQANELSSAIPEASTSSNGLMSVADKTKLDALPEDGFDLEEDEDLVSPTFTTNWNIYKQNSDEVYRTASGTNLLKEYGAVVQCVASYTLNTSSVGKQPTKTSGVFGSVLRSGSTYTSGKMALEGTSFQATQTFSAPRKGYVVEGDKVKKATGDDTVTWRATASWAWRLYYGAVETQTIDASMLSADSSALSTSPSYTVNTAKTSDSKPYYIYAYPAQYGDLAKITKDGVESVLSAFTKCSNVISVTNEYGSTIDYNVYVTANPNAIPNSASLSFSF